MAAKDFVLLSKNDRSRCINAIHRNEMSQLEMVDTLNTIKLNN